MSIEHARPTDGYRKHGFRHASPSMLNQWIDSPSVFVAQRLFGHRGTFGCAAERGKAVETALVAVLAHGMSVKDGLERGLADYNKVTALGGDPKRDSERANIEPMLEQALACLKHYGDAEVPPGGQEKIKLNCVTEDWELPVIGYLDMRFPKVNKIVDLKTTLRMPGVMSLAHQRQRVIYASATSTDVEFCYATPKKAELKADGNIPEVLADIKTHLIRLERFLQLDKETIRACVPVQPDSFYWNGLEHARKELFGL